MLRVSWVCFPKRRLSMLLARRLQYFRVPTRMLRQLTRLLRQLTRLLEM